MGKGAMKGRRVHGAGASSSQGQLMVRGLRGCWAREAGCWRKGVQVRKGEYCLLRVCWRSAKQGTRGTGKWGWWRGTRCLQRTEGPGECSRRVTSYLVFEGCWVAHGVVAGEVKGNKGRREVISGMQGDCD